MGEGFLSGKSLLIIAAAAVAAYFLFFRNSGASQGAPGQGQSATAGNTTLQKGAISITVSDNTTAQKGNGGGNGGSDIPEPQPSDQDGKPPVPETNPQPKPPVKRPTKVHAGLNGKPVATRPGTRPRPAAAPVRKPPGFRPAVKPSGISVNNLRRLGLNTAQARRVEEGKKPGPGPRRRRPVVHRAATPAYAKYERRF